jgi:hypothetical protein
LSPRQPGRLPTELARRPFRVLRPRDAVAVYAHPRPEFARLTNSGSLHKLATGYYAIVPDDMIGRPWLPELESAGLGIAAADEGVTTVALMGLSAARVHGAIPRAIGVATVVASRHRRVVRLADRDAEVVFVRRDVTTIDVEQHTTELGAGWVTTVEQSILDLAARPGLGGMPDEAGAAVSALLARADHDLLRDLAAEQRKKQVLAHVLRER